jgi:hypothetical protein
VSVSMALAWLRGPGRHIRKNPEVSLISPRGVRDGIRDWSG